MSERNTEPPNRPNQSPHLAPEYFESIAAAFQTPMPEAMPHRRKLGGPLCTSRHCLRDASHRDYHCTMPNSLGAWHCYNQDDDFQCRARTEGRGHCPATSHPQG